GHKRYKGHKGHKGWSDAGMSFARALACYWFVLRRVELKRELRVARFVLRERHRVVAGVARRAVRPSLAADRAEQAVEAQVGDTVGLEELADLLNRMRRSDQVALSRRVDAVEAGRNRRRTADADVHFLRARCAHHTDDLLARRPAHQRVVDQDH